MRKPRVHTEAEKFNKNVKPYEEAGLTGPAVSENPNVDVTGITNNRGYETSFNNTNYKPFSIGLQDIDEAIFYYFRNVIRPTVIQNGEKINVPVEYASAEKWKLYRKDGYIRDDNGALMLPVIIVKRNNLIKNRGISNKLDSNHPNLYYTYNSGYNKKNSYNSFDILNDRKPEKEFYAVAIPEYITLEYSCVIQTYYVEQLNRIVEAITYASDSYWGEVDRFQFMSKVDQISTSVEIQEGKDRFAKGSFDIKINGYILPDVIQKDLKTNPIIHRKTRIIIEDEIIKKLT